MNPYVVTVPKRLSPFCLGVFCVAAVSCSCSSLGCNQQRAESQTVGGIQGCIADDVVSLLGEAARSADRGDPAKARPLGQRANNLAAAMPPPGWGGQPFQYERPSTWCWAYVDPIRTRASDMFLAQKRATTAAAAMALLMAFHEDKSIQFDRELKHWKTRDAP